MFTVRPLATARQIDRERTAMRVVPVICEHTRNPAMPQSLTLAQLLTTLTPTLLEQQTFTADNIPTNGNRLYGGQVLSQVLAAAATTVPKDRHVHSQHAYFLRPGSTTTPVTLEVETARDGGSFSSRRVVASQQGKTILVSSLSFQEIESGDEYFPDMPDVIAPEKLLSERDRDLAADQPNPDFSIVTGADLDVCVVDPWDAMNPDPRDPPIYIWMKTSGPLPESTTVHQTVLTYMSDAYLIDACLLIHGNPYTEGTQIASLDHALWFHAPFRADEWLLFELKAERIGNARGLSTGRIYSRSGMLVASCAQEGLMRFPG